MPKRPTTVTKAEAACLKDLRQMLKRDPTAAELDQAVRVYRASWKATDTTVNKALKRG